MVMRCSIDIARIVDPANSMIWPRPPDDPDTGDDRKDDVLRGHMRTQLSLDHDPHRFRLAQPQGLRREHMQRIGRADAEGEASKCAVGGGVGIRAGDQEAGLGNAELRRDHVQDSLVRIVVADVLQVVLAGIALKPFDHVANGRVGNGGEALVAIPCLHVMIGASDDLLRAVNAAAALLQVVEGVAGAFVQKQIVHVDETLALDLGHLVAFQILSASVCGCFCSDVTALLSCVELILP